MAQEIKDFDEWLATFQAPTVEYFFSYDEEGKVTALYSTFNVGDLINIVKVDTEVADAINSGLETLFSYRVDIRTKQLIKINRFLTHGLVKIDDVLHRVVDKKWSTVDDPDLNIIYDSASSQLSFEINKKYNSTYWAGETEMIFLITAYNDPNQLNDMISVNVADLSKKTFKITPPKKFSIYTRRIFENYVFETL